MKTINIKLFLKWFFTPYGVTKVHPVMTLKYMPGGNLAGDIVEGKLSRYYEEQVCEIYGCKCWKWRKNAPPICSTWPCYKSYFSNKR